MIKLITFVTVLLASVTTLHADTITVPVSTQGDETRRTELPKRGTHHDTLIAMWGQPESSTGPVGTPPIHRFDYADFFVVLEGDWVIRSVLKARPKAE